MVPIVIQDTLIIKYNEKSKEVNFLEKKKGLSDRSLIPEVGVWG